MLGFPLLVLALRLLLLSLFLRGEEVVDKLLNFINREALASKCILLQLFCLVEAGRKGDFKSETVGILRLSRQILIEPQLYMGKIGHVHDVEHIFGIVHRTFVQEESVIA